MARVCLVGREDSTLQYELLSRETAREALSTYDLREPFANSVGVETVSLGAAVALLNDLEWYLRRFVDEAMVLEPSVSETEWLSRELATAVRDDEVSPHGSERFCKVYGLVRPNASAGGSQDRADADTAAPGSDDTSGGEGETVSDEGPPTLVEPMFVTRTGSGLPEYDLRDVDETVVERVTESEFGA